MLKQLRAKFVSIIMIIVTVMLCVIFGLIISFTQTNLEQESLQAMRQSGGNHKFKDDKQASPPGQIQLPCFTLELSPTGELIARGSTYYDLSDTEQLLDIWEQARSQAGEFGMLKDYNLRYLHTSHPGGSAIVFSDITGERSTMNALWKSCVFIGVIVFLTMLGLSLLLSQWAVKPVAQAWDQQRQFVADASHELKTPLTVITTNSELLQSPDYGAEEKAGFSENIRVTALQMRGLVESLLELARADNGGVRLHFEPIDLSRLVSDGLLPFEPVLFEKGLCVQSDIAEGITLNGSPQHLKQVVDILLDNAGKYAAAPGTITVALSQHGKSCLLKIANPGPAISKADLKNIFKRFYRIDTARTHSGSYGLGLSIAQRIVQDHSGRIWAESEAGTNTFFVQLPLQ